MYEETKTETGSTQSTMPVQTQQTDIEPQISPANIAQNNSGITNTEAEPVQQPQTIDTRAFRLAQSIRDNKQLREEFLKIINRPQTTVDSAQATPQQALPQPASAQQSFNQSLETPKSGADFFTEFESYRPDFFKAAPARVQLKDYLMKNCAHLTQDELYNVIKLAVNLENQAVQAFKTRINHQNSLLNGNEAAKQHLATSSFYPKNQDFSHSKIFSRQEISKMSAKEFKQNEREIFAQYRDGLIL